MGSMHHFVLSLLFLAALLGSASGLSDDGVVLLEIKKSLNNADNVLYDWEGAIDRDPCFWRGVSCDNVTLAVIGLNLTQLGLSGEISPAFGRLKSLQYLDLRENSLSGQIPDEIGQCVNLKTIDLSFNAFHGDIPFSISQLKQLENLILKNNQLTGPIPSTLSQLPNLKTLDLAQNKLTGEIPTLLYWSEVLQYLGLRDNLLTGNLSPDMCRLTGLWYFDIRSNNITGPIPENIGNCTSYEILDLSYNQLTGEIPFNIGFLQVATLSLQGNKLVGKIPDVIGLMQALAVLDLSNNFLEGSIPSILGNLTFTGKLYLHGNMLTGVIPPELGNMTKLSYLQLNDNNLTGQIPPELGSLSELFELDLSNNKFSGPFPKNVSYCSSLNYINVHGNMLNGTVPPELQDLGSLTYLNLSSNSFSGRIPEELGHIVNLDTMDLSENILTGHIPRSIGNLEHLLTLVLKHNKLTGGIPSEFGSLKSIYAMDLSENNLSGSIPPELGQLQTLNALLLEKNSLSGSIPPQLGNCFSLSTLNLSYNNLSGEIPASSIFNRFSFESYVGNLQLCGGSTKPMCNVYRKRSSETMGASAILGISIGSMCLLLVFIFLGIRWNQPKGFVKASKNSSQSPPSLVVLHMDMSCHTYDDIMRITDNLHERFLVGRGASSSVYKCTLKNGKKVAIKRLYNHYPQNVHEFETELATLGHIKHRNLVSLYGYSLSSAGNLLFYDFMDNGSLWDILHGPVRKVTLDWDARLIIALGAAQGLEYLHHNCSPRIIHRDVKSSNILLDERFEVHLSDFGIAKSICSASTHTSTYVMGTIGYIDPEYARTSRLNEKSDVYSFGIVLLELITRQKAVDDEKNLHQWVLSHVNNKSVMEIVDQEVKDTCTDPNAIQKLIRLALLCAQKFPAQRPTMHDVVNVILTLLPPPTVKKSSAGAANAAANAAVDSSANAGGANRRYVDDYVDSKHRDNLSASSTTSGGHLFVKFGEVISQG
ncbi:LRR receptor-like serine/threonine-protein kinase ERL1 [Selaginella moellendorffii]|uniref:LRR receptor-like serine/threonine-protein kinase ERL1 n=1 Tax=Selaginella moellendorffii TaxID=88036 RepID=UPI000D1C4207|nr:LRR receptor-like serine/threonine-protein kinase ERL1 [Selaginella moellendorffii]|eukprot:XP_024541913.1 LRR receptor-like serine/threonine-protein kinase ERL1 [Selaginella moellendorffii]